MSSTGFSRETGKVLTGFDHVQQSIGVILNTLLATRVMKRDFGSTLPELVDRPMTDKNLLSVYSASAEAIRKWEPRFVPSGFKFSRADGAGSVSVSVTGTYYPNGHLGDYSTSNSNTIIQVSIAS